MTDEERERVNDCIWLHVEAIGATYGKDSLGPIVDQIVAEIERVWPKEIK